jgi:hypothetical protein
LSSDINNIVAYSPIGVGRNLTDVGISDDGCNLLLENDVMRSMMWLDRYLPWWLASKWATQVDTSAQRLASMMRTGKE